MMMDAAADVDGAADNIDDDAGGSRADVMTEKDRSDSNSNSNAAGVVVVPDDVGEGDGFDADSGRNDNNNARDSNDDGPNSS
mmetsp:Transcript_5952/g.14710  ORF Transcript_5952/g.14710 Transcript_5952/m.14710 type:complete len:82 (+) Transcript_5952:5178-5423(+)